MKSQIALVHTDKCVQWCREHHHESCRLHDLCHMVSLSYKWLIYMLQDYIDRLAWECKCKECKECKSILKTLWAFKPLPDSFRKVPKPPAPAHLPWCWRAANISPVRLPAWLQQLAQMEHAAPAACVSHQKHSGSAARQGSEYPTHFLHSSKWNEFPEMFVANQIEEG